MLAMKRRRRASRENGSAGAVLPPYFLLLVFFVAPVAMLLLRSFTDPKLGLENYQALFGTLTYARVFYNTFEISFLVTALTVLIGFPVAWLLAIMPPRWSNLLFGIILLSMWTNLLARTYAWMVLLQSNGPINKFLMWTGLTSHPLALVNNLVGVLIGMVYIMLPFMILPLVGIIRAIDADTLRASALCGATRWQSLRLVLWPLAMPGIAAGALMVFVMSLGYYITPSLLGGGSNMMIAELIAELVQSLVQWGLGGAAAFVLLIVTMLLYALQVRLLGSREGR